MSRERAASKGSQKDKQMGADRLARPWMFDGSGGRITHQGPWTSDEDDKLIGVLEKWGINFDSKDWLAGTGVAGRSGKQCSDRYSNVIEPEIKRGDRPPFNPGRGRRSLADVNISRFLRPKTAPGPPGAMIFGAAKNLGSLKPMIDAGGLEIKMN